MTQEHILLLGAHGRISQMMIPLFLAKHWNVTALIRNFDQNDHKEKEKLEEQKKHIMDAAAKVPSKVQNPGKLDILVHSLSDVKTSKDAQSVIDKVKGVNWIVWSAGAGGKGGPEMTNAIDRDAAVAFAHAATHNNQIQRYLTVSALTARRHYDKVEWWDSEERKAVEKSTEGGMATYTEAKRIADECLTVWGEERQKKDKSFKYVVLRPGLLLDKPAEGNKKVQLGRTKGQDGVPRMDVAATAVELLGDGASGWFDLMGEVKGNPEGFEALSIPEAVRKVMEGKGITSIKGESIDEMKTRMAEDKRGAGW